MQRDVLPAAHAHAQLSPCEAIQAPHSLLIHRPAFASEQHPDAQEAEAREGRARASSRMRSRNGP